MVTLPPAGWRRALKVVDVSLKKTTVSAAALTDGLHVGQRAVWTFLPKLTVFLRIMFSFHPRITQRTDPAYISPRSVAFRKPIYLELDAGLIF